MNDQDSISPYSINSISSIYCTSDENKEKYQLGDYKLIQSQILQIYDARAVW